MASENNSPLAKFANTARTKELAMNKYSVNNQYDITKVPETNNMDIGSVSDQAERAVEIARNQYNVNNQYDITNL